MLRRVITYIHHHVLHLPTKIQKAGIHSRNKRAMEFIARGWSALKEVDRVIDYAEFRDSRLIPLLSAAKENFELALEADNLNTHARYWLSRLHLKYHVPGACLAIGAALLVEAADMGNPDAQYELACRLRSEHDFIRAEQQGFCYLQKAVEQAMEVIPLQLANKSYQLHPGALYLLGAMHLTGEWVKKDIDLAVWCFHRASEKGHVGAAIAYGSLLMKGVMVPESISKLTHKRAAGSFKASDIDHPDSLEPAKNQFEIAAKAGSNLALRWLERISEIEKL